MAFKDGSKYLAAMSEASKIKTQQKQAEKNQKKKELEEYAAKKQQRNG